MTARANDGNVPGENKRQNFAFSNLAESIQAFNLRIDPTETVVDGYITLAKSLERVALVSLAYNSSGLLGTNLKAAINANDRAEAWFEIRYNSNGGDSREKSGRGIARRRYIESEIFGLYDKSTPPADFMPPGC